jgi:PPOX class probable F420-dependent enzyme
MAAMAPDECDAFLRETRIAKLATLNADGSPNVVPVWFEWDGQVARVFTSRGSAKVRRIERDPRVALSVEEPLGVPEAWVSIEGTAAVGGEDPWPLIERLIACYYKGPRADAARESWSAMKDEWVVVRITPARVRSSAPEE